MVILKFLLRLIVGVIAFLLRLLASLILGLIVGLLAVVYLNVRGTQRQRIVGVMGYVLGERAARSSLNVRAAAVHQRADGGWEIQHG